VSKWATTYGALMLPYRSPFEKSVEERRADYAAGLPLMYLDELTPPEREVVSSAVAQAALLGPAWLARNTVVHAFSFEAHPYPKAEAGFIYPANFAVARDVRALDMPSAPGIYVNSDLAWCDAPECSSKDPMPNVAYSAKDVLPQQIGARYLMHETMHNFTLSLPAKIRAELDAIIATIPVDVLARISPYAKTSIRAGNHVEIAAEVLTAAAFDEPITRDNSRFQTALDWLTMLDLRPEVEDLGVRTALQVTKLAGLAPLTDGTRSAIWAPEPRFADRGDFSYGELSLYLRGFLGTVGVEDPGTLAADAEMQLEFAQRSTAMRRVPTLDDDMGRMAFPLNTARRTTSSPSDPSKIKPGIVELDQDQVVLPARTGPDVDITVY
jgi:hypothetical protein